MVTESARQPVYLFEGFRLDAQRRVLSDADGQPTTLTPRLFDALLYLVERAGQLLTKEELLGAFWPNVIVEEHNLNKTVSELRRALGEKPGEHRFIVTKPGRGYRFVADVSVSAATAASVGDGDLTELREHRFTDSAAPERLFQLGGNEFPPPRALYSSNLPRPSTPFVGRKRELTELASLLWQDPGRLLTLTGPGGTGKTRLALQIAVEQSAGFPDGVYWIGLAALRDAGHFPNAVAQTLDVMETAGKSLDENLAERLRDKRLLLVIDNLEHLLPAVLPDLLTLLNASTHAVVLATSRERLQLSGERVYAVDALDENDALDLLTARAADVGVVLERDDATRLLCERLDYLPLALELASARTVVFTPAQLLKHLTHRLDFLKGGRDADPRQQTLRATIEWSYDLLDLSAKLLFARLAVFRGGATFAAIEAVGASDVDTLQALVDRSLARRRIGQNAEPRYGMLETIREFAAERFRTSEGASEVRSRHARYYAELLASQAWSVRNHDDGALTTLRDELDNGRAAFDWAIAQSDSETAARVVWGLWYFWLTGGHGREARVATDRLLDLPLDLRNPSVFFGMLAVTEILRFTGSPEQSLLLKHRCLARANDGSVTDRLGTSVELMKSSLHADIAALECGLGNVAVARQHAEAALKARRDSGRPLGIAHALFAMAVVDEAEGNLDSAIEHMREVKAIYVLAEKPSRIITSGTRLAEIYLGLSNTAAAVEELRSITEPALRQFDVHRRSAVAGLVSTVASRCGRLQASARLAGFHDATVESAGCLDAPRGRLHLENSQRHVRESLGGAYMPAHKEGRLLSVDAVVALALDVLGKFDGDEVVTVANQSLRTPP